MIYYKRELIGLRNIVFPFTGFCSICSLTTMAKIISFATVEGIIVSVAIKPVVIVTTAYLVSAQTPQNGIQPIFAIQLIRAAESKDQVVAVTTIVRR